ncbi:uncharacterized protein [Argopecten irradians]|uniref:uncharacterized protein n=1 Tax=Argopecten irradians TaxID=31199 RepID=UPI003716FD5E
MLQWEPDHYGGLEGYANTLDNTKRLYQDLEPVFEDAHLRPVMNLSEVVEIKVDLYLVGIYSFDVSTQVLRCNVYWSIIWRNTMLQWDPDHYGGLDDLNIPLKSVWSPDLIIGNARGDNKVLADGLSEQIGLSADGTLIWWPGGNTETSCTFDITYYPFDIQTCQIVLEKWYLNDSKQSLDPLTYTINTDMYQPNGEWELSGTKVTKSVLLFEGHANTLDDTKRLYQDLEPVFEDAHLRPVMNLSEVVEIKVDLYLVGIYSFDVSTQVLRCNVYWSIIWRNTMLQWDPDHYGGLDDLNIPLKSVWSPDLIIGNARGDNKVLTDGLSEQIGLSADGTLIWWPGGNTETSCTFDITYYPFDIQTCQIVLEKWYLNDSKQSLDPLTYTINTDMYQPNGEWELSGTKVTKSVLLFEGHNFTQLFYTFELTRRWHRKCLTIVLPIVILSFTNCFCFCMPASSGEKTGLAISIFLTFIFLLSGLSDNIPPSSVTMSVFEVYINVQLTLSGFCVVLTILIMSVYYTQSTTNIAWWKSLFRYLFGTLTAKNVFINPSDDRVLKQNGITNGAIGNGDVIDTFDGQHTEAEIVKDSRVIGCGQHRNNIVDDGSVWQVTAERMERYANTIDDTKRLYQDLEPAFDAADMRPVTNLSEVVEVTVDFYLVGIHSFDVTTQVLRCNMFWNILWRNRMLQWDPDHYGGLDGLNIPLNSVWSPDLIIANARGDNKLQTDGLSEKIELTADGTLIWWPGRDTETSCTFDITYYPFDSQACQVVLAKWYLNDSKQSLDPLTYAINTDMYQPNGEWELSGTKVTKYVLLFEGYNFTQIFYTIELRRRWHRKCLTIILPIVILSFINCFCFCMPTSSGEKTGLAISIFLTFMFLLSGLSNSIPSSSVTMSVFEVYINAQLTLSGLCVVLTILTASVYYTQSTMIIVWWKSLLRHLFCTLTPKIVLKHNGIRNTNAVIDNIGLEGRPQNYPFMNKTLKGGDDIDGQSSKTRCVQNSRAVGYIQEQNVESEEGNIWQEVAEKMDKIFFATFFVFNLLEVIALVILLANR